MSIEIVPVLKAVPLTAKVISVGGAGSNALDHMTQTASLDLTYGAIHTNRRVLGNVRVSNQMLIGGRRLHGMGTGGDPDLARTIAEEEFEAIKKFCSDADLVFLIAGLGGGTGTRCRSCHCSRCQRGGCARTCHHSSVRFRRTAPQKPG